MRDCEHRRNNQSGNSNSNGSRSNNQKNGMATVVNENEDNGDVAIALTEEVMVATTNFAMDRNL